MPDKPVELTGDVMSLLDPQKTARAVRSASVPPLICLACVNSDDKGECAITGVDTMVVKARWDKQSVISQTDFVERLTPDTPLVDICGQYKSGS